MSIRIYLLKMIHGGGLKANLISTGNDTFDKFLGGGFLNLSLNLFEHQGPSSRILDPVWNKSLAASTLASKNNLIYINFNSLRNVDTKQYLQSLPQPRKVKSETMYKDIRGKSSTATIKIAWRYSSRSSSPSDNMLKMNQIDFGMSLEKETLAENLGQFKVINVRDILTDNFSMRSFFNVLNEEYSRLKVGDNFVNIIISDILHIFSPLIDNFQLLSEFFFALRCFTRQMSKGVLLVSYDVDLYRNHPYTKQLIYNIADCVVSCYSYETGEAKIVGYKNFDGTMEYLKVPKINSFGLHFQRELSDWGYRFTRNHRFFVIDELSLPPCHDDEHEDRGKKLTASALTNIEHRKEPLEQVGPLEDFRKLAEDVLKKEF